MELSNQSASYFKSAGLKGKGMGPPRKRGRRRSECAARYGVRYERRKLTLALSEWLNLEGEEREERGGRE